MLSKFLAMLSPSIHLVAIHPEGLQVPAGGHFGSDATAAERWARDYNALGWGVYWTVNAVRPGLHKKPCKDDITAVRFAHVDIDDTLDVAPLLSFDPPPSAIICSGNGLQPIWRVTGVEDVEPINLALAAALGGDHCHNVDRLLRLPGLTNWPSPIKARKGRVPVEAVMLMDDTGVTYSEGDLPRAEPLSRPGVPEVDVAGWEPVALDDVAMPDSVRSMCRHVMPDGERSEHVAACCAALARSGVSATNIMGLLMCAENEGLHPHIAAQADPERQALRKVQMALSHAPAALLGDMAATIPEGARPVPAVARAEVARGPIAFDKQIALFDGCTYISSVDRIATPDGQMLNASRFNAAYGGRRYYLDAACEKWVREAWTAYLQNEAYAPRTAHGVCFRPECEPGALVSDEGLLLHNLWQPIETARALGDVSPFLDLMTRMLPDGHDREVLLHWMASLVRNPGKKFMWAPVVQGTQGNGKTTLLEILEHCVGRRYSYRPAVAKMVSGRSNFNGWLAGKLLIGMEEIYVPNRRAFLEELKPYITNATVTVEAKGVDEMQIDNRANFLMLTNHLEAIPINGTDRRYAILFCAQQSADALLRDGMTEGYFRQFHAWLRAGGFEAINHYLRARPLREDLDPARGALRAPHTTSREQALVLGRTEAEADVEEVIEQDLPGLRGGWVSSVMLDRHLRMRGGRGHSLQAQTRALRSLGYIEHPALSQGRVNNTVRPDGAKPRLFIKASDAGLPALGTKAVQIERAYEQINGE